MLHAIFGGASVYLQGWLVFQSISWPHAFGEQACTWAVEASRTNFFFFSCLLTSFKCVDVFSKKASIYWKQVTEYISQIQFYLNFLTVPDMKWSHRFYSSKIRPCSASELHPPCPWNPSSSSTSIPDFSRYICNPISSSFPFYLSIPPLFPFSISLHFYL